MRDTVDGRGDLNGPRAVVAIGLVALESHDGAFNIHVDRNLADPLVGGECLLHFGDERGVGERHVVDNQLDPAAAGGGDRTLLLVRRQRPARQVYHSVLDLNRQVQLRDLLVGVESFTHVATNLGFREDTPDAEDRREAHDQQASTHGSYFNMASRPCATSARDTIRAGSVATDKTDREKAQRLIADNRKALHDYHVLDSWEAGVALLGTEVKAIREGSVNLRDSYARLENGEVWLMNLHISPYSHTGYAHHDERRQRKLLLHRHEIQKLMGRVVEKGLTLVPLRMYLNKGRVKVALALVKGKQAHDKRETIRRREVDRETRAAVKARSR